MKIDKNWIKLLCETAGWGYEEYLGRIMITPEGPIHHYSFAFEFPVDCDKDKMGDKWDRLWYPALLRDTAEELGIMTRKRESGYTDDDGSQIIMIEPLDKDLEPIPGTWRTTRNEALEAAIEKTTG